MQIINVRGTSGSGKSTLVRRIMDLYHGPRLRIKVKGRKQPLATLLQRPDGRSLFIPGHYETACGGCDTLSGYDQSYGLVKEAYANGHDVLYEGLLISGESQRVIDLHNGGFNVKVIALEVPIEQCIASVNTRRWAKNPDKPPVKERNTIAKARAVEIAMKKMQEAGVPTVWRNRDEALEDIKRTLNL